MKTNVILLKCGSLWELNKREREKNRLKVMSERNPFLAVVLN